LHHAEPVAGRRMQDLPRSEEEGDMVGAALVAVAHEIAGALLARRDRVAERLLLPGIAGYEHSRLSVRDVDQTRAIDPGTGPPAPPVRRAEVRPPQLQGLAARHGRQLAAAGLEVLASHPAAVVVCGDHEHPASALLLDPERLAQKRLRDLLRPVVGLAAK